MKYIDPEITLSSIKYKKLDKVVNRFIKIVKCRKISLRDVIDIYYKDYKKVSSKYSKDTTFKIFIPICTSIGDSYEF